MDHTTGLSEWQRSRLHLTEESKPEGGRDIKASASLCSRHLDLRSEQELGAASHHSGGKRKGTVKHLQGGGWDSIRSVPL